VRKRSALATVSAGIGKQCMCRGQWHVKVKEQAALAAEVYKEGHDKANMQTE